MKSPMVETLQRNGVYRPNESSTRGSRKESIMPAKRKNKSSDRPKQIPAPLDGTEEKVPATEDHNPRTNPAMRDGDSGRGNPSETAEDELTSDNDVGDAQAPGVPQGGPAGGAVGGTPAGKRAKGRSHTA
jgi:hypothetical protein